jgi:hypothetical protein
MGDWRRIMSGTRGVILGLVACALVAPAAGAATFDGSMALLCATTDAISCTEDGECVRGTDDIENVPRFLRIDFHEKLIRGTRRNGEKVSSSIKHLKRVGTGVVLQGVENGRGWSLSIAGDSGEMALTAAGEGVGFVLFGACTTL